MSTITRPELSAKSKYWVERHRYYELKHFCLQYPLWKQAVLGLSSLVESRLDGTTLSRTGEASDPTAACVEKREYYALRMKLVDDAASETDTLLGHYILLAVINGLSYDKLRLIHKIPCCRETYYELYRKFFWLLDKRRG